MVNKEIIIDGVDVSRCEWYDSDKKVCFKYDRTFPCTTNCSYAAISLKEQFQRTTSQYDAVVEQNKSLQGELKQKLQECEVLKEEINNLKNNFDSSNRDWEELLDCYKQALDEIEQFVIENCECSECTFADILYIINEVRGENK